MDKWHDAHAEDMLHSLWKLINCPKEMWDIDHYNIQQIGDLLMHMAMVGDY